MARDPTTAVTYANEAAYDSDDVDEDFSSRASSSGGGVLLGFDDGPLTEDQSQSSFIDEDNIEISRIGGKPVSSNKVIVV